MDEMYKAFGKNTFYIPMKDFTAMLDKYNLSVGRLEDYKGTIPEANITEIAKAKEMVDKIRNNEKVIHYDKPTIVVDYEESEYFDYEAGRTRTQLVRVEKPGYEFTRMRDLYPTLYYSLQSWYRITGVRPGNDKESFKRFPMIKPTEMSWFYQIDGEKHTLLIAAPVQEMDTLYEISERIITDDPIVFSTVGNGVIIYSMWGDEGNDEVLRKYQELNKFIAENVNLGTLTESKEAIS
jgi:hypothetical protein